MRKFFTTAFALSVAFSALLLHAVQHPCPTRCAFRSNSCRRQASPSAGHSSAGPAGRPPSPSRPAGHTRPRGSGPLYTVRRDLDGHGALDVLGGRSPLVLAAPLRAVSGTYHPGRGPAAAGVELRARVALGPRGPRGDARGSLLGRGPSKARAKVGEK